MLQNDNIKANFITNVSDFDFCWRWLNRHWLTMFCYCTRWAHAWNRNQKAIYNTNEKLNVVNTLWETGICNVFNMLSTRFS